MFPSYRNQSADLQCKSNDQFLYDGYIVCWKVNQLGHSPLICLASILLGKRWSNFYTNHSSTQTLSEACDPFFVKLVELITSAEDLFSIHIEYETINSFWKDFQCLRAYFPLVSVVVTSFSITSGILNKRNFAHGINPASIFVNWCI